ncbi:MAG: sulfonate ABC transporter substrate-binding protein [Treponema sp. GWB1_62_6]|nr:MAG: sulfonate ABC transporter substrate-binding protein [Treponema sp. GWA1_62_8]OHE65311.1 MAG: sulfonate ABC transporter substrate-binding protein [Treponema sp. GWB1_62_6]OHE67452.1 MAG: sulfonate ABC transporter substrate-binding protein [Treponema sp. GWC1_61_84]OHE76756.1 MAG: sulfonate ABC transporter substrate-binding protein [Treponema sp. RIFOXYC1_FULL_61_9]HCM28394.1 sulfonate ABC transporter substrate-binding protein [Treponema sp.]
MKKSTIAALSAALCLAPLSLAFAQDAIVVYGLKGPSGLAMVRLFEDPPVADGIPISVQALPSVDVMVAKLVSGEAKIGILPPNVAAKLAAAGRSLSVVAVVGEGMLSLLSADPSVGSVADLKGKTIEVAGQGATPDFVFRKILSAYALDPEKDLKLGYSLAYPEIAQALIAGRVSLALLPEPFATMARSGKPALTAPIDIQAEWAKAGGNATYPMTTIVVDRAFAERNPGALRVVLGAWRASVLWTIANPAEAGRLAEKHDLGLKAAVAAAAIPRGAFVFIPASEARPSLEALYRTFLGYAPASIGGALPSDAFYLGW